MEDKSPGLVLHYAIFVAENYRYERIRKADILFMAANGAYVDIQTVGKKYSLSTYLGNVADQVPGEEFVRVSRSHVVNLHHVEAVEGNTIFMHRHSIHVSKAFRQSFMDRLPIIRTKATPPR